MRQRNRRQRPNDLISAQEVASFAYCPESWRLEYRLRLEPENGAALDAGNRHHARKAAAERVAGGSIVIGRILAVMMELESGLTAYFRFYDEDRTQQSLVYRTPGEVYRAGASERPNGGGP